MLLAFALTAGLSACRNKNEDGTVQSGELVVMSEDSEIGLGIYEIDTLNPLETKSENIREAMNIIFEPLFAYDEKRNISGVLAKDYALSEDGRQITVNLKEGVKWQDGTLFTADDVVYTLSKMRFSEGAYRSIADKIHSYTATDKYQVVINLVRQETDFAYMLTFPVISKAVPYVKDDSFSPMGTGSFKISKRTENEITLEANSDWHGGAPSQKTVVLKVLKNKQSAADAFHVNELDVVTSEEIDVAVSSPKMNSQIKDIVSDNMVFLGFNTTREPLVPANIRRSISVMIDKQRLVDNEAYGYGVPADLAVNPASWAYEPVEKKEDADFERELIAKEGYVLSEGIYYKDGMPLSVRVLVNDDNAQRCAVADTVAETLKSTGFSVMVDKVSYADYIARINAGEFDIFVGEIKTTSNLNPLELLKADTNYFGFDASALKEAGAKLYGVTDKAIYKESIRAFSEIFVSDPPYVPLYFKTESVIYGSYVSGIVEPTQVSAYKNIEKWYFYDKDGKEKKIDTEEE